MVDEETFRSFAELHAAGIDEFFSQQDPSGQKLLMRTYQDLESCGLVEGMTFLEATTLSDREPRYIIGMLGKITAKGQALLRG